MVVAELAAASVASDCCGGGFEPGIGACER
jgi:hypothetical protein